MTSSETILRIFRRQNDRITYYRRQVAIWELLYVSILVSLWKTHIDVRWVDITLTFIGLAAASVAMFLVGRQIAETIIRRRMNRRGFTGRV